MIKPGTYVRFTVPEAPKRSRSGSVAETREHIPGKWIVIDRAPESATWWLKPASDDARVWATEHHDRLISGCIQAPRKFLESAAYGPREQPRPA